MPTCSIVPLLDDDLIEIRNGEFIVEQLDREVMTIVNRVEQLAVKWYDGTHYDRSTMLALPSVELADYYGTHLSIPTVVVTGEATSAERDEAFEKVLSRTHALVQVRVVSEGVDLPIRRLLDLSPCMSPVKWLQQFGRITRPDGESEYICTNRNLLRHSYLLEGLIPAEVVAKSEEEFGVSSRTSYRAIGFEGLGKFKMMKVPLANGTTGSLVCINKMEGNFLVQYAALCSPTDPEVLYARKVSQKDGDKISWGKWQMVDSLPDLDTGYTSVFKGQVTKPQLDWWKRDAKRWGLNADVVPDTRTFQALPVLANTRRRLS